MSGSDKNGGMIFSDVTDEITGDFELLVVWFHLILFCLYLYRPKKIFFMFLRP